MPELRKQIGHNIRKERIARGISMEELARISEISSAFVGLIERGQRGASVKNLVKISEIFSITIDELIHNNPDKLKVNEASNILENKKETIYSLIYDLDNPEIDFLISTIRNLRTLRNGKDDELNQDSLY